jgi:phytanoyl-CoA hydroxylase
MIGLFLQPNAAEVIGMSPYDSNVKAHALAVIEDGYTVIKNGISEELCRETIAAFRRFECANEEIFAENRDANGHYPRIVNLHSVLPELVSLFTQNSVWLQVQDVLFGAPTALYTSLFYEVGSQQPLHRDTPVFATRPEYLYFGTTVYLEPAGDENGCLEVLEGGHKIPELDREAMALRRYRSLDNIPAIDGDIWNEYQDEVTALGLSRGLGIKKLYVNAGDSLIWHPQLPHGGSPIKDMRRTRFSLVTHNTPVGVPVYHQNAFFNPNKPFSEKAPWDYRMVDGRKISDIRGVSFGHRRDYTLSQFRPGIPQVTPLAATRAP